MQQRYDGLTTAEAVNTATMAFKKALIDRALGAESSIIWVTRPAPTSPKAPTANALATELPMPALYIGTHMTTPLAPYPSEA